MKKRRLSPAERTLWRRAVHDVAPLAKDALSDLPDRHDSIGKGRRVGAPAARAIAPVKYSPRPDAQRAADPFNAGDPRLDRRAGRGRIPIEASLDLHGLTQAAARKALLAFLTGARMAGKRCVLIITGKGAPFSAAPRGVLRARLRDWLREDAFRPHVARASEAHRRHGGSGAFYVFLKSPAANRRERM